MFRFIRRGLVVGTGASAVLVLAGPAPAQRATRPLPPPAAGASAQPGRGGRLMSPRLPTVPGVGGMTGRAGPALPFNLRQVGMQLRPGGASASFGPYSAGFNFAPSGLSAFANSPFGSAGAGLSPSGSPFGGLLGNGMGQQGGSGMTGFAGNAFATPAALAGRANGNNAGGAAAGFGGQGNGGAAAGAGFGGQGNGGAAAGAQGAAGRSLADLLSSKGLTSGNSLNWPVGLQALPGAGSDRLRAQIESALELAAARQGGQPADALRNVLPAIKQLQAMLYDKKGEITEAAFQEANLFLRKLSQTVRALQP